MMRFNLLPEEERGRRRRRPDALRLAAMGGWALAALAVAATLLHVAAARQVADELALLAPRVEEVRTEQASLAALRRENGALADEISELKELIHTSANAALLELLDVVTASVSGEVQLERLYVEPARSVQGEGYARDAEGVARWLRAVGRWPGVEEAGLERMEHVEAQGGAGVQFSFWAKVVSEER